MKIVVKIEDSGATHGGFTWSSSDPRVESMDKPQHEALCEEIAFNVDARRELGGIAKENYELTVYLD